MMIFDDYEYGMIRLGPLRENTNTNRKTLLNKRYREGHHDVWYRYITIGSSGNVCILERAVPEVDISK